MDPLGVFCFECPHCDRTLGTTNRRMGATKVCPNCNEKIVVPGIFIPDRNIIDQNALKEIGFLAHRAVMVVQEAIEHSFELGIRLNSIFLQVPTYEDIECTLADTTEFAIKTWDICKELHRIFDTVGEQHHDAWVLTYSAMEISNPKEHSKQHISDVFDD